MSQNNLKNKKIIYVITRMVIGGAQETAKVTAEYFYQKGNEVILVTGVESGREGQYKVNVPLFEMDSLVRNISPIKDLRALWALYRLFRKEKPDVVHARTAKARFLTPFAARLAGVKTIVQTVHGWSFNNQIDNKKSIYIFLEKIVAKLYHRNIMVSEIDRAEGYRRGILKEETTELIRSGVNAEKMQNIDKYKVDQLKKELSPNNETIITLVGRLSMPKTPEIFVEAANNVLQKNKNIKFVLVGDGEKREIVQGLIDKYQIKNNVVLLGLRTDVAEIMVASDIIVHSSTHEGLPKTVLEGMAAKKPVIGTNVGGVSVVLQDQETGLLIEKLDVGQLTTAIEKYLGNSDLCCRVVENASAKLYEFTLEKTCKDTQLLYERLILPVVNAFTVDFEDWYQGLEVLDTDNWHQYEDRIHHSGQAILDLLKETNTKATFFILGYIAEKFPDVVKQIADAGHEIGTHGYWHQLVYKMQPEQFRKELRQSIDAIEKATGKKVLGYRAPFFSITRDSLWALDIMAEEGIKYDSSIFPVLNYRYGIADAQRFIHEKKLNNNKTIIEIPISVNKIWKLNFPMCGGAYLRILPLKIVIGGLKKLNKYRRSMISYIHPWELDPKHPKLKLPRRISLTHYHRLSSTEKKLKKLLTKFRFSSIEDVFLK